MANGGAISTSNAKGSPALSTKKSSGENHLTPQGKNTLTQLEIIFNEARGSRFI